MTENLAVYWLKDGYEKSHATKMLMKVSHWAQYLLHPINPQQHPYHGPSLWNGSCFRIRMYRSFKGLIGFGKSVKTGALNV